MAGWIASALFLLAASRLASALADVCNPMMRECPPVPALGTSLSLNLTSSEATLGAYITKINGPLDFSATGEGLILLLTNPTDRPKIEISKYIFYGRVDIVLRGAAGIGIATTVLLQSDNDDEFDIELLGHDIPLSRLETKYYGRGCDGLPSSQPVPESTNVVSPLEIYHTYTLIWTPTRLDFLIDGKTARSMVPTPLVGPASSPPSCANQGYPQTPMKLKIGAWVPGAKNNSAGTIEWGGGIADFSSGPHKAFIKSISITDDANGVKNATQYRYKDQTGLARSIAVETAGNETKWTVPGIPPGGEVTSSPSPSPSPSTKAELSSVFVSGGLGPSTIVGIAVGFVAAGVVIGVLVLVVVLQRRKRKKKSETVEGLVDGGSVVGGVDGKQELGGNGVSEMDAENPPASELGTKEIRVELNADEGDRLHEMLSPASPVGLGFPVSPLSPPSVNPGGDDVKEAGLEKEAAEEEPVEKEMYELPGDSIKR